MTLFQIRPSFTPAFLLPSPSIFRGEWLSRSPPDSPEIRSRPCCCFPSKSSMPDAIVPLSAPLDLDLPFLRDPTPDHGSSTGISNLAGELSILFSLLDYVYSPRKYHCRPFSD
jgi:hypothetical protein